MNHVRSSHDSVASSLQGKGIRQHAVNASVMRGHAHEAMIQLGSLFSDIRENDIGYFSIGCNSGNSIGKSFPVLGSRCDLRQK